jgi:hypothetical protein
MTHYIDSCQAVFGEFASVLAAPAAIKLMQQAQVLFIVPDAMYRG